MKNKIIWIIKAAIFVGLFFPLAYGLLFLLFITADMNEAVGVLILAAAAAIYITLGVLIFRFGRKKQSAQENAPQDKAKDRKSAVKQGVIFFAASAAVIVLILSKGFIFEKIERFRARQAFKNAEETVRYQNDRDTCVNIMTTPLNKNSVLIDYDTMTVTFIYYISYEKMDQVHLRKYSDKDIKDPVQFKYELSGKGTMLTVYGDWRTSGVSVETADGDFWYSDLKNEYMGFDRTVYQLAAEVENNADEAVEYAAEYSEPFDMYGTEIVRSTAGIDYDTMKLYLVYGSDGVVYGDTITMQKDGAMPEGMITAEIPFTRGTLYAYSADSSCFEENSGRCDGLVFEADDGSVYCSPELVWGYYGMCLGRYAVR